MEMEMKGRERENIGDREQRKGREGGDHAVMNEGNRQEGRESRSHREASARNRKGERVREIGREGE